MRSIPTDTYLGENDWNWCWNTVVCRETKKNWLQLIAIKPIKTNYG